MQNYYASSSGTLTRFLNEGAVENTNPQVIDAQITVVKLVDSSHVIFEAIETPKNFFLFAHGTGVHQELSKFLLYLEIVEIYIVSSIQQIGPSQMTKRLDILSEHNLRQILSTYRTLVLLTQNSHSCATLVTDRMLAHPNAVNLYIPIAYHARIATDVHGF